MRPDEHIVTRSEPYRRRRIIFYLIMGVPTVGVFFVLAGVTWLYYRLSRIEWILTGDRLILVGGWLTRNANSVSLDKINEVHYTRRFSDRVLFATGTITVETAATEGTTQFGPAADDDPFRHALEAQVEKRRRAQVASAARTRQPA